MLAQIRGKRPIAPHVYTLHKDVESTGDIQETEKIGKFFTQQQIQAKLKKINPKKKVFYTITLWYTNNLEEERYWEYITTCRADDITFWWKE